MCGIAGFTHKDGLPRPERIAAATATLVHRGPDQQGTWECATCSLGATRLKILDLESGDQPILSPDGDSVIVFNGEIYNHLELRQELEKSGHSFQSHCDTETVLHAFLEWDTGCFEKLRGMFAIAIWTSSTRRLVLARDRIGIKPLYIARRGEELYFGSELKAILSHSEIERQISLPALDCYLALNYIPAPWTMMEGIQKLTPGTWLEWRNGATHTGTYWQLPEPHAESCSLESACEELDGLLQQSVREHLISDVPLSVWLSGGLDSSTILHYASQASSSKIKTFSISFRGRSFDESDYIRSMVREYGTEHEELDLNPEQDLEGAIQEFAYYSDEPSADAGALPLWFLAKLSREKTEVALSGEGADELFGGYLTYRASRIAANVRRLPAPVLRFGQQMMKLWPVSDDKIGLEYKIKRLLAGSLMPADRSHVFWNGTFSDSEKRRLVPDALPGALNEVLGDLRAQLNRNGNAADLNAYLWFDQKYYLTDDILVKSDRISMAHSLEVRPPFLDHRIIEFANRLPGSLKIRGSRQKLVLQHLMKDKLPQAVLRRPKIGFDIPAHDWLRGPLRSLLIDTLRSGTAEYPDIFCGDVIEGHLQDHLERRVNIGYHLWGLMVLLLWMKKWKVRAPKPASATQWSSTPAIGAYI
ncbi:MAG TPA: asparagine synthase (glutamine-hydrolyzing) [Terriglobales bacterium]|nr:asparagine synthase (glutamine-hydrolyzing) [Terriglobales bacterium]